MKFITLFVLIFSTIFANYSIKPGSRPKSAIDNLRFHNIADFYNIPQNTSYYAKQIEPISYSEQLNDAKNYIKRFFAPWSYHSMHEKYNTLTWQIKICLLYTSPSPRD